MKRNIQAHERPTHNPDTVVVEALKGNGGGLTEFTADVHELDRDLHQVFVPNADELEILAKHYASLLLDEEVFFWQIQSVSNSEIRTVAYATERLKRIRETMGDDAVDRIWRETEETMAKRIGPDAWQEFCEWRAVDTAQHLALMANDLSTTSE